MGHVRSPLFRRLSGPSSAYEDTEHCAARTVGLVQGLLVAKTDPVDLHHLRCFLAVAQERNFARAADRLHLTPSPVSRAVRDLERQLGADLFIRSHHAVALTPAGELLAERGAVVLADFDRLGRDVERLVAVSDDSIRLGGSPQVSTEVLDAVAEAAAKACPQADVRMELGSTAELVGALEGGELDLVVTHLPLDTPALATRVLARYQMCAAVRAGDPLASRDEIVLADLADRTVAMLPPAPRSLTIPRLRAALERGGVSHIRVLAHDDVLRLAEHVRRTGEPTPAFVHAAGGAARVFSDPAFVLVPVSDGPEVHVGLAWRPAAEDGRLLDILARVTAVVAAGDRPVRSPAEADAAMLTRSGPFVSTGEQRR